MEDRVCPDHPEVQALSRCASCFKPLCADCIIKNDGNDFCSNQCSQNFTATNTHFNEFNKREKRRKRNARTKKIALLVILPVLGWYGYQYWAEHKETIKDRLRNKSELLKKYFKKH